MKLLNLGCGTHFHKDWTNIDFISTGEGVIAHNLLNGIPFFDNSFDVLYHSHVLEHFSRKDACVFIKECFRVLKPGGIIRAVVPDLEQIVVNYLHELNNCLENVPGAEDNYKWMLIELYDQVTRNTSGGEMVPYIQNEAIINKEFVYRRIGIQMEEIENVPKNKEITRKIKSTFYDRIRGMLSKSQWENRLLRYLIGEDGVKQWYIGQYRSSGEIHQWMYDRFSLKQLLEKQGFQHAEAKSAIDSRIPDWSKYNLDVVQGEVRKPDSLFMEAIK